MSDQQTEQGQPQSLNLTVTLEEANLILEGLGSVPYARVYRLIEKLQAQARRQIEASPEAKS